MHALIPVQVGEHLRDLRAEDAKQWQLGALEERHVQPGGASSGGRLQPDPPGADDGDAVGPLECCLDAVAVVEAAEVVDAVEVRTGDGEPSGRRAGREQEPVIAQPVASCGGDLMGTGVEGDRLDAET
jgi:hypothetical protein